MNHPLFVQNAPLIAELGPQKNILIDRKFVDQHEVLVDHPDSQGGGRLGGGYLHRFPAEPDFPGRGALRAAEDLHNGRFPCAVFPRDCVDLPFFQGKIHIVVGKNTIGIAHGDVPHLQ